MSSTTEAPTSTTLVIPTKKAKSIKPPLKKTEIIQVLALRKHAQLHEALRERNARITELNAKLETYFATLSHDKGQRTHHQDTEGVPAPDHRPTSRFTNFVHVVKGVTVTMSRTYLLDEFPQEIRAVAKELKRLKLLPNWVPDLKDVQRDIRDAMMGEVSGPGARIAALLADPATVKALDRTLSAMEKPDKPAIAA